jgi:hypothetical protein
MRLAALASLTIFLILSLPSFSRADSFDGSWSSPHWFAAGDSIGALDPFAWSDDLDITADEPLPALLALSPLGGDGRALFREEFAPLDNLGLTFEVSSFTYDISWPEAPETYQECVSSTRHVFEWSGFFLLRFSRTGGVCSNLRTQHRPQPLRPKPPKPLSAD